MRPAFRGGVGGAVVAGALPLAAQIGGKIAGDYAGSGEDRSLGQSARRIMQAPETVPDAFELSGYGNSAQVLRDAQGGGRPGLFDVTNAAFRDLNAQAAAFNPLAPVQALVTRGKNWLVNNALPDSVRGLYPEVSPDSSRDRVMPAPLASVEDRVSPLFDSQQPAATVKDRVSPLFDSQQQAATPAPAPAAQMQAAGYQPPFERTVDPFMGPFQDGVAREQVSYSTPQGMASGTRPAGTGQGGFVGASTDAEARRNQAARMQQDQMADYNVQRMQRAAEAERDARAERLGISRIMLDRLEGRPDSARNLEIQEAMSRDPGVQERLMTERGLDRRAELAARTNIETAGMAQLGQSQRKQAELEAAARAAQEGRFGDGWKRAVDVLEASDINPARFMDWTATQFPKVAGAAGISPEEIAAMIDDPSPQNLVVMMSMFSQSQQEQGKSWWRNRRTPEEIGRGFGS